MKFLLPAALFCLLATAAEAGSGVYNAAGIEIGVVERLNRDGSVLVMPLPSSGLGNTPFLLTAAQVVRRIDGGLTVLASVPMPATP
jgi:hypothetical protein